MGRLIRIQAIKAAIALRTIKDLKRCATSTPLRRRRVVTDLLKIGENLLAPIDHALVLKIVFDIDGVGHVFEHLF